MKLCHGTSARHLKSILRDGLQPRGNRKSPWKELPGHPLRVYLTTAYAFFYGLQAIGDNEDIIVVEAEVSLLNLYPDEDYVAQRYTKEGDEEGKGLNLIQRTAVIRDEMHLYEKGLRISVAEESLNMLGNASHHGPIPPDRITRIARIPRRDHGEIVACEFDPTITVLNYRNLGEGYRQFQDSLFARYPLKSTKRKAVKS